MIESMLAVGGSRGVGVAVGDIDRVIAVNLVAPIKLVHALLPVLLRARNPRVLLLGALSGLDNNASREVANIAFKAGLRGAAQAMHRELAEHGLAVTDVNPGNLATSEVVAAIAEGRFDAQEPIPLTDFLAVMDCVVSTSLLIGAGTTRCIQRGGGALSASSPSRGVFCREL
ncbi:MAG: SDR family NAD(P)-dependent oxidoreductase, partial [Spirochaetales bacterium]|nr:SDR family NAD(P)-dependent oxidoreductase [Spirochaetales bacterium]